LLALQDRHRHHEGVVVHVLRHNRAFVEVYFQASCLGELIKATLEPPGVLRRRLQQEQCVVGVLQHGARFVCERMLTGSPRLS
jgi:hypothetical protein